MKKIFFIILANFFVLVIVFFCLEFFIRIRGTFYFFNTRDVKELYIKSKNTKIAYKMHPNFKGYAYGNYVELNNEGFRFSKKRPYFDSKKKKIFGFGDSVGFGWGIPGENTFYSVLNKKFIDAKSEYEVLNYSVVGYNFEQYIFLLKELLEENKIPEIILITIVNNDFLEKQWVDEEGYLRADKNYNQKMFKMGYNDFLTFNNFNNIIFNIKKFLFSKSSLLNYLFIKYKIIFNKVPNFNRYPYENLNLTQQKTFQKNLKKLYLLSKKYKFIPVITVYSIGVSKTTHNYIKQEVLKNKIIFLDISNELGIGSIAKFREKTLQIDPHPNITTHNEIAKFLYKKLNLNLIKKD